jgi:hypothetical protein
MEVRTAIRGGRFETSAAVKFMVGVLAVFLLGGAGGYLVRGLSVPTSLNADPAQQTVKSVQPLIPYSTPNTPALPQRTLDPDGYPTQP